MSLLVLLPCLILLCSPSYAICQLLLNVVQIKVHFAHMDPGGFRVLLLAIETGSTLIPDITVIYPLCVYVILDRDMSGLGAPLAIVAGTLSIRMGKKVFFFLHIKPLSR